MKDLISLSSTEEAMFDLVSLCSNLSYRQLKAKSNEQKYVMPRSVLSVLLMEENIPSTRVAFILNKNSSSILSYKHKHDDNMIYYKPYRELYEECKDEYYSTFRAAKVDKMADQIKDLQKNIKKLQRNMKRAKVYEESKKAN